MNPRNISCVVIVALLLSLTGCQLFVPRQLPDELVGVWYTDAAAYRDRFLEIHKDAVIFGIGDEKAVAHRVVKMRKEPAGNETLYTVYSQGNDSEASVLSFYYSPGDGGTIRFKNQSMVWKKRGPASQ